MNKELIRKKNHSSGTSLYGVNLLSQYLSSFEIITLDAPELSSIKVDIDI